MNNESAVGKNGTMHRAAESVAERALRDCLNDGWLRAPSQTGDADIPLLLEIVGIMSLQLDECPITDQWLEKCADAAGKGIIMLSLSGTKITAEGLFDIPRIFPDLAIIRLRGTSAKFPHICRILPRCRRLLMIIHGGIRRSLVKERAFAAAFPFRPDEFFFQKAES